MIDFLTGSKSTGTFYIKSGDEWKPLLGGVKGSNLQTVTESPVEDNEPNELYTAIMKSVRETWIKEWMACIEIFPDLRCKTRKRYIKLMMSIGYSKRDAEQIAEIARGCYHSYTNAWRKALLLNLCGERYGVAHLKRG